MRSTVWPVLAFSLLWASAAAAKDISIGLKGGFSRMQVEAGSAYTAELGLGDAGLGMEMRLQANIDWNTLNAAWDFFYQGRLGSQIGSFPANRIGTGLYYYPTGFSLNTTVLDNGVVVTENRLAPFIMGQMMFTTVAITDSTTSQLYSFNGLAVGYQMGGGLELPVGQTWSLAIEGILEGTLSGGATGGEGDSAGLKLSAFSVLMGVMIRP